MIMSPIIFFRQFLSEAHIQLRIFDTFTLVDLIFVYDAGFSYRKLWIKTKMLPLYIYSLKTISEKRSIDERFVSFYLYFGIKYLNA